jgi:hypothetical protein
MYSINKPLLRLAGSIKSGLASHRTHGRLAELPRWSWDACADTARKIVRAELRGWQLAAAELRRDLANALRTLQSELTEVSAQLSAATTNGRAASAGDIYEDLLGLQDDFDEMDFDIGQQRLSVTTEPITLRDIYLGPFEIRLDWGRADPDAAYRIIAREPHPAESRANCIHPHVLDGILCEGHSRHTIRLALTQGRLLDFFSLVANGLRTYNEESPFVALEIWYGATCADCGAVVDEDDRYVCQRCEETICSGCEAACCGCEDSCCSQCATNCPMCDDNFCRRCLKPCQQCRENVCAGCLQEDERCSTCHDKEQQQISDPATGGVAVQPVCLGQAAVLAGRR